jgi:hypothetical protein
MASRITATISMTSTTFARPEENVSLKPKMHREAGADQHDQRHHQQRVDQQVAHVQEMAAGEHRPALSRANLLDDEDGEHEAQHDRPGQLRLAQPDGLRRIVVAECLPPVPGEPRGKNSHREGRQVEPPGDSATRRRIPTGSGGRPIKPARRNVHADVSPSRSARKPG